MAFIFTEKRWSFGTASYQYDYILDTDADAENLPSARPGSTAFSVDSGNLFMVNASGQWRQVGGGE